MSPHEFSKQMMNPYFHTDHYKNESHEIRMQSKIESFFKKIFFINKITTIAKKIVRRK